MIIPFSLYQHTLQSLLRKAVGAERVEDFVPIFEAVIKSPPFNSITALCDMHQILLRLVQMLKGDERRCVEDVKVEEMGEYVKAFGSVASMENDVLIKRIDGVAALFRREITLAHTRLQASV